MEVDYYSILKVSRSATAEDLKRAYAHLALEWHPDNNPTNRKEAKARFRQISEAYDVLSDPQKRRLYDQFREEAHKSGVPVGFRFNSRNPYDIFREVFASRGGESSCFSRKPHPSNGSRSDSKIPEDVFSTFFGGGGGHVGESSSSSRNNGSNFNSKNPEFFGGGGRSSRSRSNTANPEDIFSSFFDCVNVSSPSSCNSGSRSHSISPEDVFGEFFGGGGRGGSGSSSRKSGFPNGSRSDSIKADDVFRTLFGGESSPFSHGESFGSTRKAPPVENKLLCSLEQLYSGAKRKMKITRSVFDPFGNLKTIEEILTIDIKPGWKKGTKITFPEKGNQQADMIAADLVFVIDEKPHGLYKREGNDLVVHRRILPARRTISLPALDGRNLTIPLRDIVKPGHETVVKDEGMPIPKEPGKKGNLIIKFDV